ncbi:MAG: RNA polymerase sigma factor RpoH [Rhodospirillales bacterium]|nr:RNA polymerase sigma factor RpoH [Rhodospirillales bacterium]
MTTKIYNTDDVLARYFDEIRRFPMLTPEQEIDLAERWRDRQDPKALEQLIGSHLRLVIKIARGHAGYGLPLSDLISQGHLGLMHAARKFDPDRGVRFATYATWWIRASMQEYILHGWSLVKMGTTASQKKLFFNLRRLKGRMQAFEEADLSPEAVESIANELEVPIQDVLEMNGRLSARDQSLNATINREAEDEWQDLLAEEGTDQETVVMESDELAWRRGLLEEGMIKLDPRERHILNERRLKDDPLTLEILSQEYGISRERVRQIEVRAYEKLRKSMLKAARGTRSQGDGACRVQ